MGIPLRSTVPWINTSPEWLESLYRMVWWSSLTTHMGFGQVPDMYVLIMTLEEIVTERPEIC